MRNLRLESLRQVDDFDGLEWASLDAHTTTNAEVLGDEADRRVGLHIDAEFACLVKRANFRTFLPALLRLALIGIDNCDSKFVVAHVFFRLMTRSTFSQNYSIITYQ